MTPRLPGFRCSDINEWLQLCIRTRTWPPGFVQKDDSVEVKKRGVNTRTSNPGLAIPHSIGRDGAGASIMIDSNANRLISQALPLPSDNEYITTPGSEQYRQQHVLHEIRCAIHRKTFSDTG